MKNNEIMKRFGKMSKERLFTMEDIQKAMEFMWWFSQDVDDDFLEKKYGIMDANDLTVDQATTAYIRMLLFEQNQIIPR
jgi:hypothetical protein